jgi:hypothetical protein
MKMFGNQESPRKQEELLRRNDSDLTAEARTVQRGKDVVDGVLQSGPLPVTSKPSVFVPLGMGGGGRTHQVTAASKRLIEEEVSLADLQKMTELFYKKAFADPTLDQFLRSRDDPHGTRFAKWIHQKLSGSTVWDQDRRTRNLEPVRLAGGHRHVVHDRSSAHAAAWYSPKRPSHEVGRHFKLEECRVWMRLHFWAMRESGIIEKSPSFADYYLRFLGHFVRVYESSAPMFARDSLRWSADPKNTDTYIANGRKMVDVLGISQTTAENSLPPGEANDFVWPYNQTQAEQWQPHDKKKFERNQ